MKKILFCLIGCSIGSSLWAATTSSLPIPMAFDVSHSEQGLVFSEPTKTYQLQLHAFIEGDGIYSQHGMADVNSGTNLRRAQVVLKGFVEKDFHYAFGYEAQSKNVKNAYLSYKGWKNMYIEAGQFYPNVGFSNWLESTDINFLETPMPDNVFPPNYSQGIEYEINNDQLALHVSGYSAGSQDTVIGRSPFGAAGRLIYTPFNAEAHLLELGVSAWGYRPDGSKTVSYNTTPEIQDRSSTTSLDTGSIPNVKYTSAGALEAVYSEGPWGAQSEYISQWVSRDSGSPSLRFSGYYVAGTYFITGESPIYKYPSGEFAGITPIHNKKWGAWEVLAQFSQLNLMDRDIRGGKENNITVGVNWYLNRFIELKLDYIRAMASPTKTGLDQNDNLIGLRVQTQF